MIGLTEENKIETNILYLYMDILYLYNIIIDMS